MSNEKLDSNESTPPANAVVDDKALTSEDLLKRLATLESTNARLLDESKKYKTNYQKLKDEVDAKTKANLEEQGQYKELYTKLAEEHGTLKKSLIREKVVGAVTTEATKHAVVDMDAIFQLGNSELIQYDESNGSVQGVELYLDDLKKRKPYLFSGQKQTTVNPISPGGGVVNKKLDAHAVKKLNPVEKQKVWTEAFKRAGLK